MTTEFAEGEILGFIEKIVAETGYPILSSILQHNGVASRSTLRKMSRKGKIASVPMVYQGQYVMAYYVSGQIPKSMKGDEDIATEHAEN
jgi:hypothetical protein